MGACGAGCVVSGSPGAGSARQCSAGEWQTRMRGHSVVATPCHAHTRFKRITSDGIKLSRCPAVIALLHGMVGRSAELTR
jgi:hypothetical protein